MLAELIQKYLCFVKILLSDAISEKYCNTTHQSTVMNVVGGWQNPNE